MINLLVVDACSERRAAIVDALCELPGIEVRATADDAPSAFDIIDSTSIDAVVATNDLPGAAIVTLIDCARRHGVAEIFVVAEPPTSPVSDAAWRDLGARHVVHTMPELCERIAAFAVERSRNNNTRRPVVPIAVELASVVERPASLRAYADADVGAFVTRGPHRVQASDDLALGTVLNDALTRFGGVVPSEVQLHLEVGGDVPRVRCTAADIERIALVLIRGACDALPLGGTVWLCVEREGQRHVRIEVLESSGRARSPVSDLDVIRAIATRHGGELRVVDLGGATSVQVILPATVLVQN